jgi:Raf kinase inhibitor-like YbhB/YbcL family protein
MNKEMCVVVILLAEVFCVSKVVYGAYNPGDARIPKMVVGSAAFEQVRPIPRQFTCDGADLSVPIEWKNYPAETKSIAIICDDPDAPRATPWVHWVIFNIPPDKELKKGIPRVGSWEHGIKQGLNDFTENNIGYRGPCPPRGKPHRYFFKVYALNTFLALVPGITKKQLLEAMGGHVLAYGELIGTYQRVEK